MENEGIQNFTLRTARVAATERPAETCSGRAKSSSSPARTRRPTSPETSPTDNIVATTRKSRLLAEAIAAPPIRATAMVNRNPPRVTRYLALLRRDWSHALIRRLASEDQLQSELNLPRRGGQRRDQSSRCVDGASGKHRRIRRAKVRVVQHVEALRAELHADLLRYGRVFKQRHIDLG